ncbi:hypothetical protein RyT2_04820 [Pseudolactococcus yaeyamensis]
MKVEDIIKNLEIHNLEFSVVHFNKKVLRDNFDEKIKNCTVKYLESKGYNVYSNNELHKLIFLNNDQHRLLLITKKDSDSDTIIVSNEDLTPHMQMVRIQSIPNCYREILEKFKDTELYSCVERILYHIEKNYTLSDLSAESCMTSRNFTRQFKAICGMSFLEFYRPFKMDLAKYMLISGMKVSDVAEKLGFNETSYFNRVFKKIIGMTPSTYKEIMK